VIAERDGKAIAASLVIYSARALYGRYWGALEHVDCLHFEAAYYQPLEFCIEQKIATFEGGAQGEHKMARGFLPQKTWSAHWLAHPAFADAIERFLARESGGIDAYIGELNERNPFRA
jgi:predicted N-acyltransferase